jgi:hypothetical protein
VAIPALFGPVFLAVLTGDAGAAIRGTDGRWAYAVVFVLAAIPWWEILLVVPPAIGLGLNPLLVGVVAFLGNVLPIYLIVAVHGRVTRWLEERRGADDEPATRSKRASRLLERYGLGGLALAAPLLVGVHLATVIALLLGASPRAVAGWMTVGIAVWTVLLVAASTLGFGLLGVV